MSTDDSTVAEAETWPELAIGLYERLTGRGAEITYEFEDMQMMFLTASVTTPTTPAGGSTAPFGSGPASAIPSSEFRVSYAVERSLH